MTPEMDIELLKADPQHWYDLSFAVEPDPRFVIPKPGAPDAPPMRPFQQAAAQQAWLRKHAYCGHHPGTGKTIIALALSSMYGLGELVVVVCPPAIAAQWARQGRRWTGAPWYAITTGEALQSFDGKLTRVVIPDSIIHKMPALRKRIALLVIDEAHRMKEQDAQRTKAVFGSRHQPGISAYADKILALSGTPIPNNPYELFPVLHAMHPATYPKFQQFAARYSPPTTKFFNGRQQTVHEHATNTEELSFNIRSTLMIRPRREDVLGQLPPVTREIVGVGRTPTADARQDIERQAARLAAIFAGEVSATEPEREEIATIRRQAGLAKVDDACRLAEVYMEGGDAPMIWCWHRAVAIAIAEKLRIPMIHGGMNQDAREASKQQFLDGARGIVCTLQAAGTGLDGFQARGNLGIFVERDYVPLTQEQAEGRLVRMGQAQAVRFLVLVANHPIDIAIDRALSRKERQIADIVG